MYKFFGVSAVAIVAASSPAYAGEEVLYEKTPAWVQSASVDMASMADGPSEVLYDRQHRLDDGVVHEFTDRAVRIDNLEALTSEGTLQMTWAPDKGDLYVHRMEILRGDEVIDLVADGVEFEIIRREQGLESRLLDGRLTATVAVPGLEEGDVLRVSHSITLDDQALGEEMQALQYLPPEPYRVGMGRTIVSWPVGDEIGYRAGPMVDLDAPVTKGGFKYLTVNFPISKRIDMPGDAPSRFSRPPILRVGSFADWKEMSRVMEPHFTEAASIPSDGDLMLEVEAIMDEADDPLKRTELAVRLVQDQVSYLLNGLDGGNYLPQTAEETWEKRYGDCKAKSVLLLALLRAMDIESDVVLVTIEGGDALPDLLPLPANFDHMIVRATVGGIDYWLDGTSTATRMSNMGKIPPFYHALPLTAKGADLTPISDRSQAHNDYEVAVTMDHTAGIDLPPLYTLRMEISGAAGAGFKSLVDEGDPETDKQMMRQFSGGAGGRTRATSIDITYDDETAIAAIVVEGVGEPMFDFNQGKMELSLEGDSDGVSFSPNRVRPKWRDIPIATNGPSRSQTTMRVKLPDSGEGYTIKGDEVLDATYANTRYIRTSDLNGGFITLDEQSISDLGEVAVADLAAARRAALQISKSDLILTAPDGAKRRWEFTKQELAARTSGARAQYTKAVEQADDDDFDPLQARANYFSLIYDFERALADYSAIIAEEPTASLFLDRSDLYVALGRMDEAIADVQSAYELSPVNSTATWQAELMARSGKAADALELLELLPTSENEIDSKIDSASIVLGLAGRVDEGLDLLAERLKERTDSATLLAADCWYRGLHAVALEEAIAQCNRAVERANNTAGNLDSRAMVHYRLGDMESALADLDAALKLRPGLSASRYLRGIIMLEQGDSAGKELVEIALRQRPHLGPHYSLYGIEPQL